MISYTVYLHIFCIKSNFSWYETIVCVFLFFLTAIGTFDIDKTNPNLISLTSYPTTFNSDQKNYFVTQVGVQNNLHCTNSGIPPTYFQVGASGACTGANCNGLLPSGQTMRYFRFQYLILQYCLIPRWLNSFCLNKMTNNLLFFLPT